MHACYNSYKGGDAGNYNASLLAGDNRQRTGNLDIVAKGLVDGATMYQVEFLVFAPTLSTPS